MFRKLALTVPLLLIGLLMLGMPVYAIGNPTYVTIGDVYVFRNVTETGDQLYFARYDVSYAGNQTEAAEDTWQMALYNSSGGLVATRPLNYFQHNIISIYLTSAQAIAWAGAHSIRIMGMPSVFNPLIEGTNMRTRVLSPGDYYEKVSLGGVMLTQAEILQADWGIVLLTSNGLLNTTGANYFTKAVPGLSSMVSSAFAATTRGIPWERGALNTTGINATGQNIPTSLVEGIQGLDQIFGVTNHNFGGFSWVLLMGLIIGGAMFGATSRPDIAVLGGLGGVIGISAYLGVASPNVMYTLVAIALFVVFLFTLVYVIPRMGGG